MLIDIPAVASTEGLVQALTWVSAGTYRYTGTLHIPGAFTSGTFTDDEALAQDGTAAAAVVNGASQSSGSVLIVDAMSISPAPNATGAWAGDSSLAGFQPTGLPYFPYPERVAIYIDTPSALHYRLPLHNRQNTTLLGALVTLAAGKNPAVSSTMKFLTSVAPTFQIPVWVSGAVIRNISGADMHLRAYRPNIEANVIDTTAKTFGEADIVGILIRDDEVYTFQPGGFKSGTAWMLCAAAAAVGGAIVEFNP